jgi:1,4-dihydroxy-2-naphthoate octaprenyltransferase
MKTKIVSIIVFIAALMNALTGQFQIAVTLVMLMQILLLQNYSEILNEGNSDNPLFINRENEL